MHPQIKRQLLLAASAVILSAGAARAQVASPGQGRIWNSTWSDEFNTGASDLSGWTYDLGGGGWGNNEKEVYTNSSQNAFVATDGTGTSALHIDAIATGSG